MTFLAVQAFAFFPLILLPTYRVLPTLYLTIVYIANNFYLFYIKRNILIKDIIDSRLCCEIIKLILYENLYQKPEIYFKEVIINSF